MEALLCRPHTNQTRQIKLIETKARLRASNMYTNLGYIVDIVKCQIKT